MLLPSLLRDSQAQIALAVGAVALASVAFFFVSTSPSEHHNCGDYDAKPRRKVHTTPNRLPLVGDVIDILRDQDGSIGWMLKQSLRFNGEPWSFRVPSQPEIVVFTLPEDIADITITQLDNFPKGEYLMDLVRDMFGAGMITSDGARWYHQRKAASRFFSAKVLRTLMQNSMRKNMAQVCQVLDAAEARGETVDIGNLIMEFTIETFAEMGVGVSLNCIGAENPHPFQEGLDASAPVIGRRFQLPKWVWKVERFLGVGPEGEMKRHMKIVTTWLHETIEASLAASTAKRSEGECSTTRDDIKSVIELFIDHGGDDIEGLRADDLVDFMLTFVIAARDTTGLTLCWMLLALRDHPVVMHKLRDEFDTQLSHKDRNAYITPEDIKSMVYLEAVIHETLRLFPAAPFTVRQAACDTLVRGDVFVRKGQLVGLGAWGMARHPRVWGPDAAQFKPERWIDVQTGKIRSEHPAKFFSFSAGPRSCIGQPLGMLELRVVTANLLHRYDLEIDPSNDGSYVDSPTLMMKYPLLTKVKRIA